METAAERKKRIAKNVEAAVPAAMRWCRNHIYEIGRVLHPEEELRASSHTQMKRSRPMNTRCASSPRPGPPPPARRNGERGCRT
jgi:hypothetical protein